MSTPYGAGKGHDPRIHEFVLAIGGGVGDAIETARLSQPGAIMRFGP